MVPGSPLPSRHGGPLRSGEGRALTAEQSLREGRLEETLEQLQGEIRRDPANARHRVFLFQLQAVLGDWDRAMTQLRIAGELDAGAQSMVQTYQEALRCEMLRAEIFAGQRTPLVFGEPEPWVAVLLEALRLTGRGEHAGARELRDRGFEDAPAVGGKIDDTPFEWIADADVRLGPILEAVVNGRYYWIPFARIRDIRFDAPADLRDTVWMPANFTWSNGGEAVGLVPTRYPGSQSSPDNRVRLARRTEWVEVETMHHGLGQRMLATDAGEYPLMDVRWIHLDSAPAEESGSEPTQEATHPS